jgi:hypothetical protein
MDINPVEFEKFCKETISIYFDPELGAPWYPMPPSLHRVLYHGRAIIEACPVPLGITSKEGSESNNRFARDFEANHARKSSNENTFMDVFHRLMDKSDPFLVASSGKDKSHKSKLSPDMINLVLSTTEAEDSPFGNTDNDLNTDNEGFNVSVMDL